MNKLGEEIYRSRDVLWEHEKLFGQKPVYIKKRVEMVDLHEAKAECNDHGFTEHTVEYKRHGAEIKCLKCLKVFSELLKKEKL